MKNRGFTLIESVIAISLTALVLGAVTAVHIAVVHGLGVQSTHFVTERQEQALLDTIDSVATQSSSYSIVNVLGEPCLKLVMPASCIDSNSDGIPDKCVPDRLMKTGVEEWGSGTRVWFYKGDATARPVINGPFVWIGICANDTPPSAAWLNGTSATGMTVSKPSKYNSIDLMTFASSGTTKFTVGLTDSMSMGDMSERKDAAAESAVLDNSSISRFFYLRGWHK